MAAAAAPVGGVVSATALTGGAPGAGGPISAGTATAASAASGKAPISSLHRKGVMPPVTGSHQQQQKPRGGSARKEQPGTSEIVMESEDADDKREYVLEEVSAEDEDNEEEEDEEFEYQHIPIEEFEDLDEELADEDLEQAVRNINEKNFLGAFPETTAKPIEAVATLTKQPEVIDDYIRNYLSNKGMARALDAFQNEWYELQQRGILSPEDAIIVPDVYQRNMSLEEAIKKLRIDLEDYKDVANKARSTYSKLRKERDFHRMHHKRVLQEKNKLIADIKKLKKHYENYEPMLKQIQHKYEIAMKERMLVRLERDKLAAKVHAMEANLKESAGKEEPRSTSSLESKRFGSVSRRGSLVSREAQLPTEDRLNPYTTAAPAPRSDVLGKIGCLKRIHAFRAHEEAISSIKFHPRKMILATASDDKTWRMWAFPSGELIMSGDGHRDWLGDCDFHPRGAHLATASGDGTVKLWDFSKGESTLTLTDHSQAVWSCAFHDQGDFLASGSMDHTCKLWDLNTGKCRQTFHGHSDSVNHVSWMPYTNVAVTAACDKTVRLWDGRTGTCTQTLYGHGNAVNCAVFTLQADKLASCDASGFLKHWDVRNGIAELDTVDLGPHPANRLCFDPSGTIVAVASNEGSVKFWNALERIRAGRDVGSPSTVGTPADPVQAVAFDKTAECLVAAGAEGGINVFS